MEPLHLYVVLGLPTLAYDSFQQHFSSTKIGIGLVDPDYLQISGGGRHRGCDEKFARAWSPYTVGPSDLFL